MIKYVDSIYLNKHEDRLPDIERFFDEGVLIDAMSIEDWTYYRLRGSEEVGGTLEVCRVSFPSLEDVGDPISTPGVVGYMSVPEHIQTLLKAQWGVDHSTSIFIGLVGSSR
jgi:hypothetical protein